MPIISMFYGIIVRMYFFDNLKYKKPHIHVYYNEFELVYDIKNLKLLEGSMPSKQFKLLEAWVLIHQDQLLANWELAVVGVQTFKIEALK